MGDCVSQPLLRIKINSLSLPFMNHTQEKSAILKGHVRKHFFSVVKQYYM